MTTYESGGFVGRDDQKFELLHCTGVYVGKSMVEISDGTFKIIYKFKS